MRKVALATAAVLAAVFLYLLATLPPAPARYALDAVDQALKRRTVRGAYHIHTTRSDGAGSKHDVTSAAARAGLHYVILTDHGDGTLLDPPAYVNGVLCIDGVEISTNGGHYVALGMSPAPYPLGGEASAVVEDVRRLGGVGVAAHPDHPLRDLAWSEWDAPFDGLEWINADADWRDEQAMKLTRVLFDYLFRPASALASTLDRPVMTLERWDALDRRRPVFALAAVDAHGGARARPSAEKRGMFGVGPSYEASFRSVSNRVILDQPLTGDAGNDSRRVLEAIRAGRVYSVVDGISPDVVLSLSDDAGFEVASPLPPGAQRFSFSRGERRRIEVHAAKAPGEPPAPWVLSNWSGVHEGPLPPLDSGPYGDSLPLPVAEWHVEKDEGSSGRISSAGDVIALEYRLRVGERASQFVAAVGALRQPPSARQILFRGRATNPMRVAVQLRFADDRRWIKSVYLDHQEREITIDLPQMVSAERTRDPMPPLSAAKSVLFVVDLVNARPSESGGFTISRLRVR